MRMKNFRHREKCVHCKMNSEVSLYWKKLPVSSGNLTEHV